jgi:hypothetical protein
MLAGLLFATHDAIDRPGTLTATLPFGGTTLIEHQARTLVELGAAQIVIVVARLTPELLGAIGRIGRRGVAVDPVRSAGEAADKLHPLARVLVLADGLITTAAIVAPLAGEGLDAMLVIEVSEAPAGFERVGGNAAWAGVARLDPARIAEAARLPNDYDFESALVRVAAQARSAHMLLPRGALSAGHGIEHHAAAVADQGRAVLAASVAQHPAWFDRWLVAPIARVALPRLIERGQVGAPLAVGSAMLGLAGLGCLASGHAALGMFFLLLATVPLALSATLCRLRDERSIARSLELATALLAAAGALLLGRAASQADGRTPALAIAAALVVIAALAERAALPALRARWWATPPALLLVLTATTALGWPATGLALAAVYASATLSAAIETLRQHA